MLKVDKNGSNYSPTEKAISFLNVTSGFLPYNPRTLVECKIPDCVIPYP